MSGRSNKMTIRVEHQRTTVSVVFTATGHFGRKRLGIAPTKVVLVPVPPSDTTGHYWSAVADVVKAEIAAIP